MTRQSRVWIAFVAVGVGWCLCVPGLAAAAKNRKRIAVLEIEGARNPALQKSVAGVVRQKHRVVSDREYSRAARELRARKMNPTSVAKVAEAIEADGIIQGMLVAEGEHYVLRLRLREGVTGRTVRKFSVYLRSPKLNGKLRSQLADKLYSAIDNLEPLPAPAPIEEEWDEEVEEDEFQEGLVEEEVDEGGEWDDERAEGEERPERRRRAMRERDDAAPMSDDRESPMREAAKDDGAGESAAVAGPTPTIVINGGVSAVARSLQFNSRAFDEAPLGYEGALAPSALVDGAFYPLANSEGPLAKVGVGFVFEQAIGLESKVVAEAMEVALPTDRTRYGFNARYRHAFGDDVTSPSVELSAGYNKLRFTLDQTALPEGIVIDVPNTEYTYFDPGLQVRYPINAKAALLAEAKGMLVTDAGEIATPELYGTATITGVDGDVAVEYRVMPKIVVKLGAHVTYIAYAFEGNGEQAINRDGDPMTVDVGGAVDQYLGGYISAGYRY